MARTEMKCELCGGFSSTRRCHPCSTGGAGLALLTAEFRIAELETDKDKGLRELALRFAAAILDVDGVNEGAWVDEQLLDPEFARGFLREQRKLNREG